MDALTSGWHFTAPWDPLPNRRGDPLGFRAAAEYFADLMAPGLTNATVDARWISILSWALHWSDIAWRRAVGTEASTHTRDGQRVRYEWLRPLELLWIARTLAAGQESGQLRGRRSIERWVAGGRKASNFAMSNDQFRRYRQIGMYGAYRVLLRKETSLTSDNGWTPATAGVKLAEFVHKKLPRDARFSEADFDEGIRWSAWREDAARFWVSHGWSGACNSPTRGLLPTANEGVGERLAPLEVELLAPVLFAEGSVRRRTAELLARARSADNHAELCDSLAEAGHCEGRLEPLPAFTRLADAAMAAVRTIWEVVHTDERDAKPRLEVVIGQNGLRPQLELAREASVAWLKVPGRGSSSHLHIASQLAERLARQSSGLGQLRAIIAHHQEHGGGRRWFREHDGRLIGLLPSRTTPAADYRFRLVALIRLAAQCGIARMDSALDAVGRGLPDVEQEEA